MRLSLSHSRTSSSSARSSSPAGSPTAFLPPSPLLLGGGGSPAHAHQHRRRRSSHPLLLSRSTLARHRWLLLALLALSLWLALSARTVPFVVLGSTYVLSSSFPPPVLGQADGFDLALLVPSPNRSTPVVPRVIHQVQLGGLAMRPAWAAAREACATLHPADDGWVFRLWDDAAGDAFVRERYPHLFALYRSYDQEIMRSNVLRYLVLHAFGGIYLDLDLRCRVKLDAFLGEDFVTPPAQPIGVNNAFIVAKPGHPFFAYLIDRLPRYHLSWFSSAYATNMFSTGCHFFSAMHLFSPDHSSLKVLPWDYRLNGKVTTPLFEHLGASSWHKGDARFILGLGKMIEAYKPFLVPLALALLGALAGALCALVRLRRVVARRFSRAAGVSGGSTTVVDEPGEMGEKHLP